MKTAFSKTLIALSAVLAVGAWAAPDRVTCSCPTSPHYYLVNATGVTDCTTILIMDGSGNGKSNSVVTGKNKQGDNTSAGDGTSGCFTSGGTQASQFPSSWNYTERTISDVDTTSSIPTKGPVDAYFENNSGGGQTVPDPGTKLTGVCAVSSTTCTWSGVTYCKACGS